ncbi:MAG TPA: cation transporter, partial [Gemmatimonadaceae bacterium]|nr:cation transporter [Gemmatimonadaceae bacterium]
MPTAEATLDRVTIPVGGMTCAACQARVQRTLARSPGVAEASVNLMLANATVAYDPAATNAGALVDAIRATGYSAELPVAARSALEEQERRDRDQEEEFRALRRKAIASGVVGVIAMVLSMPLMVATDSGAHAASDPFMHWASGSLTPALRMAAPWLYALPPRAIVYALFVLTGATMLWAGRHFYTRAITGLRHRS